MKESIHNIRSSVDCFILWVKRLVSLSITSHNICDGHKKGHKTGCLWENHSHHLLLGGWNTSIYEAPKDLFGLIETLYSVEVQLFSFWLQHPCCLGKNWLKVDLVWTNFSASDYLPTPWTGHGVARKFFKVDLQQAVVLFGFIWMRWHSLHDILFSVYRYFLIWYDRSTESNQNLAKREASQEKRSVAFYERTIYYLCTLLKVWNPSFKHSPCDVSCCFRAHSWKFCLRGH